ncbi:SpoIIE family protein phosphatase [Streptomyces sp.]|uniref:SpoIIE family protein phosphatase n=1 Tax=Streptomyces sp. TaxID=1931 RepID=UPI002F400526
MPGEGGSGAGNPGRWTGLPRGASDQGAPRDRAARGDTGQGPAFAGAALTAVYLLDEESDELRLTQTDGGPADRYGLASRYPVAGRSPVADAFRVVQPLWLDAAEFAACQKAGPEPEPHGRAGPHEPAPGGSPPVSLAVLPLLRDNGRPACLVVVDDDGHGFARERRHLLELYADHVAARLAAGAELNGPLVPGAANGPDGVSATNGPNRSNGVGTGAGPRPSDGLALDRVGSFTLTLSSGRIDADARLLSLFDLTSDSFDGHVDTLLVRAVPDDLPALMSIVEPRQKTSAVRELEFRVRRPHGEPRWLSMRYQVLGDRDGKPELVLGVLADASRLRPSVDEVSVVQRLSATLGDVTTVRDVGRLTVAALRGPLGADRMALAEIEGDRLVVTVLDPPQPTAWPELWRREWRSEWPDVPTGAVPTLRAALAAGRISLWPPGVVLEPGLEDIGPGGLAALPLTGEGRLLGVCLIGWEAPHEFTPEERSLLTATAGLVGQALARARAFDAQRELATMLQRSLLPRTLPDLPSGVAVARYLPATAGLEVGGDWYDVLPLSEDHVALVIGDVQGHNAGAATIMGQIRTAIRAYAVEGHPPDVVVSHTNRLLVGMETELFATCLYVDLDMVDGDAWLVRAGHPQPLLRHPDGSTEEVVVEGGPPLGVLADAEYPMTTIGLSAGSVLALLTDGLVESAETRLEDGVGRVRDLLSRIDPAEPARAADELLGGAARRDDDVALLLLRYDGMKVRPIRASSTVWRLPDAVMHARRYTRRTLRSWGVGEAADEVLLIVSELVTNALVHTQGPVRLDLTLAGDRLRVAVSDASPRTPVKPASLDWEATGGRGLLLVEAMAASWGSVPLSGGKQVWGEVAVTSPPGADAESVVG